MNRTIRTLAASSSILATAAFSGLLIGCMNHSSEEAGTQVSSADLDKHACKGQNACKGHGGCKTAEHACKGQNSCKGAGGCKTI